MLDQTTGYPGLPRLMHKINHDRIKTSHISPRQFPLLQQFTCVFVTMNEPIWIYDY